MQGVEYTSMRRDEGGRVVAVVEALAVAAPKSKSRRPRRRLNPAACAPQPPPPPLASTAHRTESVTMAQNMPTDPTRLGPEGYIAPTPRQSRALPLPSPLSHLHLAH